MVIVDKKIDDIKPYEKNPRRNDQTVKYLVNSIKKFGFKVPLVVDNDGVIITGHTRYKAAKELGLDTVPCIIADDLTQKQIKAFRIIDNKVSEISQWNDDELKEDIVQLMDGFDMTEFGFGNFELSMLLEDMEPEKYDDELISEYSRNAEKFLANKKVIIFYEDGEEEMVKKLINRTGYPLKVIYRFDEIKEGIKYE